MAYCPNCGSQVEGRFCARCGVSIDQPVGTGTTPPVAQPSASSSGMSDNVASALCYLLGFITGIIFLVLAPYNQNRNVRFHAFQSIFLNVAMIVLSIALGILSTILWTISVALGGIFSLLYMVFWLGFLGLWLFLMFKAYNNQKVVLPVVGPLAEKQA
jgi:uncharacterized membrane protein